APPPRPAQSAPPDPPPARPRRAAWPSPTLPPRRGGAPATDGRSPRSAPALPARFPRARGDPAPAPATRSRARRARAPPARRPPRVDAADGRRDGLGIAGGPGGEDAVQRGDGLPEQARAAVTTPEAARDDRLAEQDASEREARRARRRAIEVRERRRAARALE